MKLIYENSGKEVAVGDIVDISETPHVITYFRKPHKPDSEGKISVSQDVNQTHNGAGDAEYYVSAVGAKWIEREDRGEVAAEVLYHGASAAPLITAEDFLLVVGRPPIKDDLHRCNCPHAGEPGHMMCGWDWDENKPVFLSSNPVRLAPRNAQSSEKKS